MNLLRTKASNSGHGRRPALPDEECSLPLGKQQFKVGREITALLGCANIVCIRNDIHVHGIIDKLPCLLMAFGLTEVRWLVMHIII